MAQAVLCRMGATLTTMIRMEVDKMRDPKDVLAVVMLFGCIKHYHDVTTNLDEPMSNELIHGLSLGQLEVWLMPWSIRTISSRCSTVPA